MQWAAAAGDMHVHGGARHRVAHLHPAVVLRAQDCLRVPAMSVCAHCARRHHCARAGGPPSKNHARTRMRVGSGRGYVRCQRRALRRGPSGAAIQ